MRRFIFMLVILSAFQLQGSLYLKENFRKAEPGDFIVTSQCKNYTLLTIQEIQGDLVTIEEITVPQQRFHASGWKNWVEGGAPNHSCWVRFTVDLRNGTIVNSTHRLTQADQFLPTLLNLRMEQIPHRERKKIGQRTQSSKNDRRPLWQPPMIFQGERITGVQFEAWRTRWPQDGSDLSGKVIVAYVPEEGSGYPAYFPYWLQVNSVLGKAKIQIIDSGTGLKTP